MRHHHGQLGFVIRGRDGPDVHVHWTTGQGECIDFLYVHRVKRKRPLVRARRVGRQRVAQPLDIFRDRTRVGKHWHLAAHFLLRLLADFNVLFRRVLVKRSWLNLEATGRRLDNVAVGSTQTEGQQDAQQQRPCGFNASFFQQFAKHLSRPFLFRAAKRTLKLPCRFGDQAGRS
jgi:hypothetical protein